MFTPSPPVKAESQRETSHASRSVPVTMMATCDGEGVITWFRCEDMRVVEMMERPPAPCSRADRIDDVREDPPGPSGVLSNQVRIRSEGHGVSPARPLSTSS